ncbi:MAG: hypothetical protein AAFZ63_02865 [Bacteroidota bacterium]
MQSSQDLFHLFIYGAQFMARVAVVEFPDQIQTTVLIHLDIIGNGVSMAANYLGAFTPGIA